MLGDVGQSPGCCGPIPGSDWKCRCPEQMMMIGTSRGAAGTNMRSGVLHARNQGRLCHQGSQPSHILICSCSLRPRAPLISHYAPRAV